MDREQRDPEQQPERSREHREALEAATRILLEHAKSRATTGEQPGVHAYVVPPRLTDLLREAQAGKYDVLVTLEPRILSDDPEAVSAVEEVLRSLGVRVDYVRGGEKPSPPRQEGRRLRAATYARDLAQSPGVERVHDLEGDQAELRDLIAWAESNEGATIGSAEAVALIPGRADPGLAHGYILVRERSDAR